MNKHTIGFTEPTTVWNIMHAEIEVIGYCPVCELSVTESMSLREIRKWSPAPIHEILPDLKRKFEDRITKRMNEIPCKIEVEE